MGNKMKKKRLTQAQGFEILKLVLDKFLWLGVAVMVFGLFTIVSSRTILEGFSYIIGGAIILMLFIILIINEYESLRK